MTAVDVFAGPGGWDLPAREMGLDVLGIELDADACATREAAGLRTLQGDVAALDPLEFAPVEGLIASAPCPSFSRAGKRLGLLDMPLIIDAAQRLAAGEDPRLTEWHDARSGLTLEPLRWALALRPQWVAFEQVPDVLPLWRVYAEHLRAAGYGVWTGLLSAECYGVPQTRERAFLMATLGSVPSPPPPTHQAFDGRGKTPPQGDLFGEVLPWVSMAEALGLEDGRRFRNNSNAHASERGADEPAGTLFFGKRSNWAGWIVNTRGDRGDAPAGGNEFSADRPSWALTEKARSWHYRTGAQRNASVCRVDEPAGTVAFGHDAASAGFTPDPTDTRVERLTVEQASILQSFPPDYPWQGSRSSQFLQIGNAVPPLMAGAVLRAVATIPAARAA